MQAFLEAMTQQGVQPYGPYPGTDVGTSRDAPARPATLGAAGSKAPTRGLVAQSAFGRFCAACERQLNEGVEAWDARTGRRAAARATASGWDDLLPLCVNCLAAAEARPTRPSATRTCAPTGPPCSTDAAAPPFTYVSVPVAVRGEDEAGDASAPCTVERVLVRGHTPAAVAMIERFALNTPHHVVTSSATASATRCCCPPAPRSGCWTPTTRGSSAAPRPGWTPTSPPTRWPAAPPGGRGAALRSLGWGMRFTGFWSVWAQVLWDAPAGRRGARAGPRPPGLPRHAGGLMGLLETIQGNLQAARPSGTVPLDATTLTAAGQPVLDLFQEHLGAPAVAFRGDASDRAGRRRPDRHRDGNGHERRRARPRRAEPEGGADAGRRHRRPADRAHDRRHRLDAEGHVPAAGGEHAARRADLRDDAGVHAALDRRRRRQVRAPGARRPQPGHHDHRRRRRAVQRADADLRAARHRAGLRRPGHRDARARGAVPAHRARHGGDHAARRLRGRDVHARPGGDRAQRRRDRGRRQALGRARPPPRSGAPRRRAGATRSSRSRRRPASPPGCSASSPA